MIDINNNLETIKANYADSQLRALAYIKHRLKYWEDKRTELDTWAAQGFSHGRDYNEEHIPQNHYKGDKTEELILSYGEKLQNIEDHINELEAKIKHTEEWMQGLKPYEQQLLRDYYLKGKAYNTMAQLRGVTKNTIREHIRKILLRYPDDI